MEGNSERKNAIAAIPNKKIIANENKLLACLFNLGKTIAISYLPAAIIDIRDAMLKKLS